MIASRLGTYFGWSHYLFLQPQLPFMRNLLVHQKNTSIDSITANALYLIFIVAFFSYPTDRANIPNFGIHTVKILNGNHLHECSTDVL